VPAIKPLGRNEPCHCGSGRKYKQCCLAKDEASEREARAKAAEVEAEAPEAANAKPPSTSRHSTREPWRRGQPNTRGFQRVNAPRRVGGGG